MSSPGRRAFMETLREAWHPMLFESGFKGDDERFQRTAGDVIHVIALQENKHGGSCCVNLGVQLAFLPLAPGGMPQAGTTIRVESCEFQWRLAPSGFTDYWWAYERGVAAHLPLPFLQERNEGPAERARHLAQTYEACGGPAFDRLSAVERVAESIRIEDLARGIAPHYSFTAGRAGLTMARIHRHLRHHDLARRFAEAGLERAGRARAVRADLEAFLAASPAE